MVNNDKGNFPNTNLDNGQLVAQFNELRKNLAQHIIGQESLLERLIIALLADGHLLVEGAPGLAKTKAIKTLSSFIEGSFQRIQFTPDLLPTDITGTEIYRAQTGEFNFEQGPVFNNLILADEINRAPAKAQSALLEAMAERQTTIGRKTYKLPELFLVMATQNPIEQQGTYPLPEAQLDRFLLHVNVAYPCLSTEKQILKCVQNETKQEMNHIVTKPKVIPLASILEARKQILDVYMGEELEDYLLHLIVATRNPQNYLKSHHNYIEFGASPRATIALARCARVIAWLAGRNYVIPEDIKTIVPDVLRHRILVNYLAEADKITSDHCINEILQEVAVP